MVRVCSGRVATWLPTRQKHAFTSNSFRTANNSSVTLPAGPSSKVSTQWRKGSRHCRREIRMELTITVSTSRPACRTDQDPKIVRTHILFSCWWLALEGYAPLFRPETSLTPVRGHRLHIGGAWKKPVASFFHALVNQGTFNDETGSSAICAPSGR